MIVTMIPYCPRSEGINLGLAYNELMNRLRDEDWACFIDHDACFTTHDWYAQLEEITAGLTEPCVLTAVTNRVGSLWQLAPGVDRGDHAMDYHRRVGRAFQSASRRSLRDVTDESLMSGVVILLSKKTWSLLGGFAEGFLGVDNAIHQAARDRGCRVYLMEGVYVYHWYRADGISSERSVAAPDSSDSNGRRREPYGNGDVRRERWDRVTIAERRILLIGHDVASTGEYLRSRNPATLTIVEMDESAVERARECLGEVRVADDEGNGIEFAEGSFDAIIAYDLLEQLRRPARILPRLRSSLACDGRLISTFRTVRSLPVVEQLLTGRWSGDASQPGAHGPFDITRAARPRSFYTGRVLSLISWKRSLEQDMPSGLHAAAPAKSEWAGSILMDCLSRMPRSFTPAGSSSRLSRPRLLTLVSRRLSS